jgi:glutamine amidotransferase-like uncharacterized protein
MNMKSVVSSVIKEIGWEANTLRVVYHGGTAYDYENVPKVVYDEALNAISVGSYIMRHVKGQYAVKKVQ